MSYCVHTNAHCSRGQACSRLRTGKCARLRPQALCPHALHKTGSILWHTMTYYAHTRTRSYRTVSRREPNSARAGAPATCVPADPAADLCPPPSLTHLAPPEQTSKTTIPGVRLPIRLSWPAGSGLACLPVGSGCACSVVVCSACLFALFDLSVCPLAHSVCQGRNVPTLGFEPGSLVCAAPAN